MMPTQIRLDRPAVALLHHLRVTCKGRRAGSASPVLAGDNCCVDLHTLFCFSLLSSPLASLSPTLWCVVYTNRPLALLFSRHSLCILPFLCCLSLSRSFIFRVFSRHSASPTPVGMENLHSILCPCLGQSADRFDQQSCDLPTSQILSIPDDLRLV